MLYNKNAGAGAFVFLDAVYGINREEKSVKCRQSTREGYVKCTDGTLT